MDGDGKQVGLPGNGGTPSAATDTPSGKPEDEKITLTQAELNQRIEEAANQRHSKLDSKIAALTGENESLKNTVAIKDTAITQAEQRARDLEIKAAGENPEIVNVIKARHALEDKQREIDAKTARFEAEKKSHTDRLSTANAVLLDQEADKFLSDNKLTGEKAKAVRSNLLKFGGDTPEKIREYGNSLVVSGFITNIGAGSPPAPRPGGTGPGNTGGGQPKTTDDLVKDLLSNASKKE
jgi:hypothetical protein